MQIQNLPNRNPYTLVSSPERSRGSLPQRIEIERFIQARYAEYYGADIQVSAPLLLCIKDELAEVLAAVGLTPAAERALFLENYLEQPAEQVLSGKFNQPVARHEIIEVGNLAVSRGFTRALIVALTAYLTAARYKWVMFTIGPMLKNSFSALGLPLTDLGAASADVLPDSEMARWGSYYDQQPRVMAGRLADARTFLERWQLEKYELTGLWRQANLDGSRAA